MCALLIRVMHVCAHEPNEFSWALLSWINYRIWILWFRFETKIPEGIQYSFIRDASRTEMIFSFLLPQANIRVYAFISWRTNNSRMCINSFEYKVYIDIHMAGIPTSAKSDEFKMFIFNLRCLIKFLSFWLLFRHLCPEMLNKLRLCKKKPPWVGPISPSYRVPYEYDFISEFYL